MKVTLTRPPQIKRIHFRCVNCDFLLGDKIKAGQKQGDIECDWCGAINTWTEDLTTAEK